MYSSKIKETILKKAYNEIFNDKIITYSQSKIVHRDTHNSTYAKEGMYYNNLKNMLANGIIKCTREMCKG